MKRAPSSAYSLGGPVCRRSNSSRRASPSESCVRGAPFGPGRSSVKRIENTLLPDLPVTAFRLLSGPSYGEVRAALAESWDSHSDADMRMPPSPWLVTLRWFPATNALPRVPCLEVETGWMNRFR